jgi:hypothetical protein
VGGEEPIMPKVLNGAVPEVLRVVAAIAAVVLTLWIYNRSQANVIATKLGDIDKRLAVIENNRFTSGDGLTLAGQFYDELKSLRGEIAKLPKEAPPKWLIERMDRFDVRLDAIDGRLHGIERRLPGG